MIEQGIPTVLAPVSTRVYPKLPQVPTFPLVRYQRISTSRDVNVDATRGGVNSYDIQIDCMAKSYSEAKQLAKSTSDLMHTYRGSWASYQCQLCVLESESDFEEIDGDDYTAWVSQRYIVYLNED